MQGDGVVWAGEREGFHEVGQSLRTRREAVKFISGALWASRQMPDARGCTESYRL